MLEAIASIIGHLLDNFILGFLAIVAAKVLVQYVISLFLRTSKKWE